MGWTDILIGQLTDPFRIGLIIALVITDLRTQAVTGKYLPLAAGVLFIAVIIPTTMASSGSQPVQTLIGLGLVANAILLAIVLGIRRIILMFR